MNGERCPRGCQERPVGAAELPPLGSSGANGKRSEQGRRKGQAPGSQCQGRHRSLRQPDEGRGCGDCQNPHHQPQRRRDGRSPLFRNGTCAWHLARGCVCHSCPYGTVIYWPWRDKDQRCIIKGSPTCARAPADEYVVLHIGGQRRPEPNCGIMVSRDEVAAWPYYGARHCGER